MGYPAKQFARGAALALALLACCSGARAQAPTPGQTGPKPGPKYRLQPGDEVTVTVLPRAEYSSVEAVPPDGLIHLKNLGAVKAAGLTVDELTEAARKEFERVLKRPRVTITLSKLGQPIQVPQVTVTGAVTKGGAVNLEEGLRVRKAIELAGGALKEADLTRVSVVHKDLSRLTLDLSTETRAVDPQQNRLLQDGDSIEVPLQAKIKVTVVGGVVKPGPLEEVDAGSRLRKAIQLAGGTIKDADLTKVAVTHADQTHTTVDLSGEAADDARNLVLKEGDSVEVPLLYKPGSVSIGGEVLKGGTYELTGEKTLEGLIVDAGKTTLVADFEHIELQRRGKPKEVINLIERMKQGVSGQIKLEPGDQVYVPKQENVIILIGAVPNPGPRSFKPGQTVKTFFTEGPPENQLGLDESKVSFNDTQLLRQGQPNTKIHLRDVLRAKGKREDLALQNGDVLYLPARVDKNRDPVGLLRLLPFVGSMIGFL